MPISKNNTASCTRAQALAWFFGILFFLSSADQSFTTHLFGFNLRWGQPLLFITALFALVALAQEAREGTASWEFHKKLLAFWLPFFAVYLLAAVCSPT